MTISASPLRRLPLWLHIQPAARTTIYCRAYADAALANLAYWLGILLSAGIATLGLVLNSPAVIIGAMLISPLMDPIMAAGLGLALGDLYLVLKSVLKLLASVALASALSALLVWLLPFHSPTSEILARTNPTLLDLGVALLSGIAGSLAVSRSGAGSDGMTTLPGVAIAVALMPPLCTIGFGIGSGLGTEIVSGASLLFLTNIVAIVFSAFLIFLAIGINCAEVRAEMERCPTLEPAAQKLSSGPLAAAIKEGGKLRWRVLVLLVLLAAVARPLQIALRQLAGEARTRDIVDHEIAALVPKNNLVSQQTEVGSSSVAVHVVATVAIPASALRKAESDISSRTGRKVNISVESIASQSELASLVERLRTQAAPSSEAPSSPPPPPSLAGAGADLRSRVGTVLADIWPNQVPLVDFELVFAKNQPSVQVHYQSAHELDPVALDLLTHTLQTRLATPGLQLQAVRVPLSRSGKQKR